MTYSEAKSNITPLKLKEFLSTLVQSEKIRIGSSTEGLLARYLRQLLKEPVEVDLHSFKVGELHSIQIPPWYVLYLENWGSIYDVPTVEEMIHILDKYYGTSD